MLCINSKLFYFFLSLLLHLYTRCVVFFLIHFLAALSFSLFATCNNRSVLSDKSVTCSKRFVSVLLCLHRQRGAHERARAQKRKKVTREEKTKEQAQGKREKERKKITEPIIKYSTVSCFTLYKQLHRARGRRAVVLSSRICCRWTSGTDAMVIRVVHKRT